MKELFIVLQDNYGNMKKQLPLLSKTQLPFFRITSPIVKNFNPMNIFALDL